MTENVPAVLDKKAMIENIMAKLPQHEAEYVLAVLNNNVMALGSAEVFAIRNDAGEIKAFKQRLSLNANEGTLIQPVPGGPYVISAQGYETWAAATGTSVTFPKEVLVDGQWMQNPAVIRDPTNRRILCVYARAVAFGFSNKGLPQVCDWTTFFDLPSYRLIDLIAKAKDHKMAFRLLPAEMGMPEKVNDADHSAWARYPFDEATNLWVDTSHDEALKWFSQILNREKKALDFAQTFARRNALKHLSGLQKVPKGKPGRADEWDMGVLCWKATGGIMQWDGSRYSQLQEKVGAMISGRGAAFTDQQNEIEFVPKVMVGSENVDAEETLAESVDPEDDQTIDISPKNHTADASQRITPEPSVQEPSSAPTDLSAEDKKIIGNFGVMKADFPVEFRKACIGLRKPVGDDVQYSTEEMSIIMKKVSELVDTWG